MAGADETVFESVRRLVGAGEYRDTLPGRPGVALEGPRWTSTSPDGSRRRMYERLSAEYAEAHRAGVTEPLPALAPASLLDVEDAEDLLNVPLPPLLRRLYLEVGNGGWGPGYGVLGLRGGHKDDEKHTAVDILILARQDPESWWSFLPAELFPVCYWGCGIYSFVDCSSRSQMWGFDPNPGPTDAEALFRQERSFSEWLEGWIEGDLFQPVLVEDPPDQWRGATEEEIKRWMAEL